MKVKMKAQGILADVLLEGKDDEYLPFEEFQVRCNKLRRQGERREDGQSYPKDEKLDLWVVNAAVVPVETLTELTDEQEERYREKIRKVLKNIVRRYEGKTSPEEIAEADNKVLNILDSGTDDKLEGILDNVAPTVKTTVEKLERVDAKMKDWAEGPSKIQAALQERLDAREQRKTWSRMKRLKWAMGFRKNL